MENYFKNSQILNCDCYVADYTNATDSRRGVVIATEPFDDIPYFHLKKHNRDQNLPYIAVNFEDYPGFIHGAKNCECMFSSLTEADHTWLLFLETKYCEVKNIEGWAVSACRQMNTTLQKIKTLNQVDVSKKRIYFAYSVPGHDDEAPFGAFAFTQNDVLDFLEDEIMIYGYNTVLIATPQYLFVPHTPI